MKRLIVANTFYQIIFSIQMRKTIFKEDWVELIITDHSKNALNVASELKKFGFFNDVHFVRTLGSLDNRGKTQRVIDALSISFLKSNEFDFYIKDIKDPFFDEFMVFNYDIRMYGVFAILSNFNHNIKLSRFEEGILSYNTEKLYTPTHKIVSALRKIQKKNTAEESTLNFYCYYPDLYMGKFQKVKVPLIEKSEFLTKLLQQSFGFNESNMRYSQKYIFFTSVYDFEGGNPIGEYELVCKVANLVGKDNLLVKIHPRDYRTIYADHGFNVDENSAVPWEAIQLAGDFSEKVFLTVNSGSVLAGSIISKKPVHTFYMYKLCNIKENVSCKKNVRDIESLLKNEDMKDILQKVDIAEKLEDIL